MTLCIEYNGISNGNRDRVECERERDRAKGY